jgi:hypothetical protein
MDVFHLRNSHHRRIMKGLNNPEPIAEKQN